MEASLEIIDQSALLALRNLAVALAIGFLIGFEREWAHAIEEREHTFAGARTFALIGLLGGLIGMTPASSVLAAAGFIGLAALTTVAHWVNAREKISRGGTTEVAIFVTYFLGIAATQGHLLIAAIGGVSVAIILNLKATIKTWAKALTVMEISAALRFLAISIIILPILPDKGYGPYSALNPRTIWLMVVFISGLSFLGYWLTKTLGAQKGTLLTGIVGGLASSTATTLSLAKFARDGSASPHAVAAGIIAANVVMLIRVGLLLGAVARSVLTAIWPVLAAGAVVGAITALILWRSSGNEKPTHSGVEVGNPMEFKPALFFAILLAAISLASGYGADQFGASGLYIVGLISGLADVDALTLAAGRQAALGGVSAITAGGAILLAVGSNIVVKGAAALGIGGSRTGIAVCGGFAAAVAAGAITFFLLH